MTTANKITLTRIAMIPFFIYFAMQTGSRASAVTALVLFCIASVTDFLDGYVARKYNQVTDFGKFVDPLADKLLVTSALVIFVEQGLMAGWMVCIILAREFIITSLRIVAANKGRVMAAAWSGKVKTCVQIAGVIIDFLYVILTNGMGATQDAAVGAIGGSDGPTAILVAGAGLSLVPTVIAWVMTLVTLYSGWDYLHKNWDLIRDGAVK